MKTVIILAALLMCACGSQSAIFLANDSNNAISYCKGDNWVKCSHDACPNGYDIVKLDEDARGTSAIKCKP